MRINQTAEVRFAVSLLPCQFQEMGSQRAVVSVSRARWTPHDENGCMDGYALPCVVLQTTVNETANGETPAFYLVEDIIGEQREP